MTLGIIEKPIIKYKYYKLSSTLEFPKVTPIIDEKINHPFLIA